MSYLLVGSLTSPITRKLRILLHDRIEFTFKAIDYTQEPGNSYLKSISPINKIPVLFDGEQKIYDSRVIYNYLSQHHNWKALTPVEENILSEIEAVAETAINLFSLKRGGLDLESGNTYIARQGERIDLILKHLTPWVQSIDSRKPDQWNYLTISLFSFLYWAQFRKALNLANYPVMRKFLDDFQEAPGVRETTIPE